MLVIGAVRLTISQTGTIHPKYDHAPAKRGKMADFIGRSRQAESEGNIARWGKSMGQSYSFGRAFYSEWTIYMSLFGYAG